MKNALLVACITIGSAICPFVAQAQNEPVQAISPMSQGENNLRGSVGCKSETFYLNSPTEYTGSLPLSCQKVSTYSGGPRGTWRTYYRCSTICQ
jgi:hypothetical protein